MRPEGRHVEHRFVGLSVLGSIWDEPAVPDAPRRTHSDWTVVAFTLLVGSVETLSSGLGWPLLRAGVALVVAWLLLRRRRAPLVVLILLAGITLATSIALRIAGHGLPFTGLTLIVAIYALVRWGSGRQVVAGLGVVAAHAIAFHFVDPNSHAASAMFLYGGPVLLGYAIRLTSDQRVRRSFEVLRGMAIVLVLGVLFTVTQGAFIADQLSSYVTRTRSPEASAEWSVDAATLRRAADASQGTHGPHGAIRHTVDYPHQLLAALESPTFSVEGNVTVIDGTSFLQHDPRDAVGLPLLEFLEYAAIADIPIVKLDLKRDRVGTIIGEVQEAIDRFGLDSRRVQFNADVFRGPGIENDVFGARSDMSFTDRLYNLIVMESETSDLIRVAEHFPESTIVISSTTPTGSLAEGYSRSQLEQFTRAASEIRQVSPDQRLAFAVRGDLAAQSGPHLLEGLTAVENSYVAAWWSADVRPEAGEREALRAGGVTFFDPGPESQE